MQIMDTGQAVAREVARRLNVKPVDNTESQSAQLFEQDRFLTTGDVQHFQRQLDCYWPAPVQAEQLA